MDPKRRAQMDRAVANAMTLGMTAMLQEALAEIDTLQAEATSKPPLHVILDRPGDYPDHPVARLALERDDLRQRLMEAAPKWQEGEPPEGVFVWREENGLAGIAHIVIKRNGVCGFQWLSGHPRGWHPWGTARWAPIARPT